MKEYFFNNLENLVISSLNARFSNYEGYILEAKCGKINLSILENVSSVDLHFKRIAGNGKIYINDELSVILSKTEEIKNIKLKNSNIIISRPHDSVGEIAILGIKLHLNKAKDIEYNWRSIVNKFSNYKGLSLIKNELYVSEGGYIEPSTIINEIETDPPNSYIINDNKLIFNCNCNVVNIKLNNLKNIVNQNAIFFNREVPKPIITNLENKKEIINNEKTLIKNNKNSIKESNNYNVNIVYDSDKFKGFNKLHINQASLKNTKIVFGNGKNYLSIKPGGAYCMPLSMIENNFQYMLILNSKKNSGNGKVKITLLSEGFEIQTFLLNYNNIFEDRSISFNIKENINLYDFKIVISMSEDSGGEILISRLMIINGMDYLRLNNDILKNNNYSSIYSIDNLSVKDLTKDSAWTSINHQDKIFSIPSSIKALCYSARQYIAQIASYIDGVTVIDNDRLIENAEYSFNNPTLIMGKLNRLEPGARLYIEEWDNKVYPSNKDLEIIKNSDTILTTSVYNYVYLKTIFSEKNIKIISKPRVHLINSKINKSNYIVYFEKNINITKLLINTWKPYFPNLYIVGTNLNVPNFINKTSEYTEYNKVYQLLANADSLLDLGFCNQYNSSLIQLAQDLGCKIITNNVQNINSFDSYLNVDIYNSVSMDEDYLLQKINQAKNHNLNIKNNKIDFKNFLVGIND